MEPFIKFDRQQFNEIFPFHVLMDKQLNITSVGSSMEKMMPAMTGRKFTDCFKIHRPSALSLEPALLHEAFDQMLLIKCHGQNNCLFKGQLEKQDDQVLFLGNPWFFRVEELEGKGLSMADFPFYDNTIDLLHVLKTEEIASGDLRELIRTIRIQKAELRKTATELELISKTANSNEKKFRSIIDNMNLGLLEVDMEERITFANQSICQMAGYSQEELIGNNPKELFVRGKEIEVIQEKNELRKKGISDAYEVIVTNKKGESRWWLISGAPRFDENGQLQGTIGIHLDITDQKNLELELIEAKEKASRLARSREQFLANMSHEMRTPMNAIVGMSDQLAKTKLNYQQQFNLELIQKASESLLVIMNDILDISKIEAGQLSVERIGFDPEELIREAISVLRYKANEQGTQISYSVTGGTLSPVLIGDPYRINQVFMNLLSNAIKFTREGSVHLSAELVEDLPSSQTLEFRISDTGIGMDDEFVKKVFDPFRQEERSTSRRFGGSGLGMSISKQLVELMGGAIQVKSQKGIGTTVSFQVSFEKGEKKDLPVLEQIQIRPQAIYNKSILIVDDNDVNRMIAARILEDQGAIIFEACDGQQAVQEALRRQPDIILMDLQMPVMNGNEAAASLRDKGFDKPIIAVTANAMKGEQEKSINAGMNDHLIKPFGEMELLRKVEKWLYHEKDEKFPAVVREQKHSPEQHLFSLDLLSKISKGDNAFLARMLNIFCRQTPELIHEIKLALQSGEKQRIGTLAHKLKPSIDNLQILSLKEEIRILEMAHTNDIDMDRIGHLVEKLGRVMDELIPSILEEVGKMEPTPVT